MLINSIWCLYFYTFHSTWTHSPKLGDEKGRIEKIEIYSDILFLLVAMTALYWMADGVIHDYIFGKTTKGELVIQVVTVPYTLIITYISYLLVSVINKNEYKKKMIK